MKRKLYETLMAKPDDPRIPAITSEAVERINWLFGFMTVRYHFVYQVLGILDKQPVPSMDTMGVAVLGGGKLLLGYNPIYLYCLTDEEKTYVMYHEILHLVLHHCTSRRISEDDLANIAQDLAVNELIPIIPGSCEPPKDDKGKLTIYLVNELRTNRIYADIENNRTAEWYYSYLKQKALKNPEQPTPGYILGSHSGWKEDEVAATIVRAKVSEIDKMESWGSVSASAKELIKAAQERRINWGNILRKHFGNYAWPLRESTRKRPNRRTGFIHPGNKKLVLGKHLIVFDTSGSMDADLLARMLGILNQIVEEVPIDEMQVDCTITSPPRPYEHRHCNYVFHGRGGTSFDPIMKMVDERHYKSVVILTDGEASPCNQPKADVVWVLPEGKEPPVKWGKRIHLTR